MITLGLIGSTGKMGKAVRKTANSKEFSKHFRFAANDFESLVKADAVIDFSRPKATIHFLNQMGKRKLKKRPFLVIGTTGWTKKDWGLIVKASKIISIFYAPNFSIGVHLLKQIIAKQNATFIENGFWPDIIETHHKNKKDKPSGTALALAKLFKKSPPIQSFRKGQVVGVHHVRFRSDLEEIVISHTAHKRDVFAKGALTVALWFCKKKPRPGRIWGLEDYLGKVR